MHVTMHQYVTCSSKRTKETTDVFHLLLYMSFIHGLEACQSSAFFSSFFSALLPLSLTASSLINTPSHHHSDTPGSPPARVVCAPCSASIVTLTHPPSVIHSQSFTQFSVQQHFSVCCACCPFFVVPFDICAASVNTMTRCSQPVVVVPVLFLNLVHC